MKFAFDFQLLVALVTLGAVAENLNGRSSLAAHINFVKNWLRNSKTDRKRRLSKTEKKAKWSPNPESLRKLEKYALTSLMTMISLRIAQDSNSTSKSKAVQSRRLGLLGSFVRGNSLKETKAKQAKDLAVYLRQHRIRVSRRMSQPEMQKAIRGYFRQRFNVRASLFDSMRKMVQTIQRMSLIFHRANKV